MKSDPLPGWEIPREFWPGSFFAGRGEAIPSFLVSNPARIWLLDTHPASLVSTILMPGQIGWICFLSAQIEANNLRVSGPDTLDFWSSSQAWFSSQGCIAAQFLSETVTTDSRETTGERLRIPDWLPPICDFWDLEWRQAPGLLLPRTVLSPWKIRENSLAESEIDLATQTMEDSLDCPELARFRSNEAAWESLLQVHGRDIPCRVLEVDQQSAGILLAVDPSWESARKTRDGLVAYLGLIPKFRGQGWGKILLGDFLARCGSSRPANADPRLDLPKVMTMVDARNRPALTLYENLGFQKKSRGKFHLANMQPFSKS